MSGYTKEEFVGKAEWEGGLLSLWFDYGFSPDEFDAATWDAMPTEIQLAFTLLNQQELRDAIWEINQWMDTVGP